MRDTDPGSLDANQTRREWSCIALLTLLGACFRFWRFGRLGLTHFDEGIYAGIGAWSLSTRGLGAIQPELIPYAPPGYPILVGLAYNLLGVSDAPVLLVSVLLGTATIPLMGWLGRRTFGPGAGASAAAFAAISIAHIAFSRKALTDVSFLFAWTLALGLGGRFLEKPGFSRALVFGLGVGLAQNFKYNGWLAGAVVPLAVVTGWAGGVEHDTRRLIRILVFGIVAALVAAACYWPWYVYVASQSGGYAALVRHHRSYLGDVSTWLDYLKAQLGQIAALSGGPLWGLGAWLIASGLASFARRGLRRWNPNASGSKLFLVAGAAISALAPDFAWWIGLLWSPRLIVDPQPARRILGLTWILLSILTPFYHPYARLWLPIHAAGWTLLAGLIVTIDDATRTRSASTSSRQPTAWWLARLACVVLLVLGLRVCVNPASLRSIPLKSFFMPTDDLRRASAELDELARLNPERWERLRLLGRRPLDFYLNLRGRTPIYLLSSRKGVSKRPILPTEHALLDEAGDGRNRLDPAQIELPNDWTCQKVWRTRLDPVTLLDLDPGASNRPESGSFARLILLAPVETP